MKKNLYFYENERLLTSTVLELVADAEELEKCTSLRFGANSALSEEAVNALVNSPHARNIESLEFIEIRFTPQQFERLLSLPALEALKIAGGVSSDWSGPEYHYPTLQLEHIAVLETSPHAQRLRSIDFYYQEFSDQIGRRLRQALPNLESLFIEGKPF